MTQVWLYVLIGTKATERNPTVRLYLDFIVGIITHEWSLFSLIWSYLILTTGQKHPKQVSGTSDALQMHRRLDMMKQL